MKARTLVAGVGNVLLGDDGFGVEVARRLRLQSLPDGVRVEDFGVRALHLAYELLEPYEAVVLVDAMARGEPPGTVCVLQPDVAELCEAEAPDAHGLHPAAVLRIARELGADVGRVRIVGCEPEDLDEGIGLSPSVERAVDQAVRIVHQLLSKEVSHEATT
jgi:hydrogenase maturation protease